VKQANGESRRRAAARPATGLRELNSISEAIIGATIEMHKAPGPGLLESTYEACLAHELAEGDHVVERQKGLPMSYRGLEVDCGYRVDLLVDGAVLGELQSTRDTEDIHRAQLLTCLKLAGLRLGLLMNCNVPGLGDGVHRMVNGYAPHA